MYEKHTYSLEKCFFILHARQENTCICNMFAHARLCRGHERDRLSKDAVLEFSSTPSPIVVVCMLMQLEWILKNKELLASFCQTLIELIGLG